MSLTVFFLIGGLFVMTIVLFGTLWLAIRLERSIRNNSGDSDD